MKKYYARKLITIAIATSFYLPASFVNADGYNAMNHDMHNDAHNEELMHDHGDNPLITKVMFDQLETHDSNDASLIQAQAWIGKDLNKFWLKANVEKSEGEKNEGKTEETEIQALYSHAIATYWDAQIGVRKDLKPTPSRTWGVLGVQGLAPYFFNVDAALFFGDENRTAARVSVEYDLLFTQRLILSPEIEINIYGQNDAQTATGSGLSEAKAGLRLRYEIRREFAPYVGINWNKKFGATADFAQANKEAVSDTSLVAGIRIWF